MTLRDVGYGLDGTWKPQIYLIEASSLGLSVDGVLLFASPLTRTVIILIPMNRPVRRVLISQHATRFEMTGTGSTGGVQIESSAGTRGLVDSLSSAAFGDDP